MLFKKFSRQMSLIMVTAMLLGIAAAGCSKKDDTSSTAAATAAAAQSGKMDPIKLEFMLLVNTPKDDSQFVAKKIFKDKFNADVTFTINNGAGHNDKLKLLIASDELPDIISPFPDDSGPISAKTLGSKGALVAFDKYFDKMPNYKKYVTQDKQKYVALEAGDGHIYNAPQISEVLKISSVPMIRMDLVKGVNMQVPKTMKELVNVLKAIKEKYPQTIGIVNSSKADFIYSSGGKYNTNNGMMYDATTDKWIYAPLYSGFKEMMTDYNQLWKDGILDREFFTASGQQNDEKISKGLVVFMEAWGHYVTNYTDMYKKLNPNDSNFDLSLIMPLTTDNYKKTQLRADPAVNTYSSISVSSKTKNLDRILQMIDYMYSDEGITAFQWGIKGTTYTEENGKKKFADNIKTPSNPNGTIDPLNDLGLDSSHILRVRKNDYLNPVYAKNVTDMYEKYKTGVDEIIENNRKIALSFSPEQSARINEINSSAKTIVDEATVKFITGDRSLNDIDNFYKSLEKVGVRDIEKIYADAYADYKKKLDAVK